MKLLGSVMDRVLLRTLEVPPVDLRHKHTFKVCSLVRVKYSNRLGRNFTESGYRGIQRIYQAI